MGRAPGNRDDFWGADKQRTTAQVDLAEHQDEPDILGSAREISLIAEEEEFLVVDKPAFVPSTPNGRLVRNTVQQYLRQLRGEPDIVALHRLDRLTSGLLLLSRNPETRGAYQQLFHNHEVGKTYECLTVMPDDWDIGERRLVELYLRNKPGERGVSVVNKDSADSDVKLAQSTVTFLGPVAADIGDVFAPPRFIEGSAAETRCGASALQIHSAGCTCTSCGSVMQVGHWRFEPHTGRTHQIRATMNELGYPILGEDTYPESTTAATGLRRISPILRLVATELSFVDPLDGHPRRFQSGLDVTDLATP